MSQPSYVYKKPGIFWKVNYVTWFNLANNIGEILWKIIKIEIMKIQKNWHKTTWKAQKHEKHRETWEGCLSSSDYWFYERNMRTLNTLQILWILQACCEKCWIIERKKCETGNVGNVEIWSFFRFLCLFIVCS